MKQLAVLLAGVVFLCSSCEKIEGEGPVVSELRTHNQFTGIDLRASADVFFTIDTVFRVELRAQQNILDVLETYISNNNLVIRFKNDVRVKSHDPIQAIIHLPAVSNLRISGSGDIRSMSNLVAGALNLEVSGSGDIELTGITATDLEARISGSGSIRAVNGVVGEERLTISGSGDIDLAHVATTKAVASISGSGNIWVTVSQILNATISGSGSVHYKGQPQISASVSGSGKVKPF